VTPILVTVLAIPLALLLDSKMKTRNIQRAIFFFPSVISALFLGYIWNFILSPSELGLINSIRVNLGQSKFLLLADPHMAMILLIMVNVWCLTGWHACIYLANIQMIDKTYYEAAEIDGAGGFAKFRTITFPFLAPAMTVSVMLLLTGSLKAFDLPFALTNGGPGYATTMVTQTIITEGISSSRVGFASAMSFLFFIVISVVALFQVRIMRTREENLV
jgi:ABC-type sugar transport system permease subunit